MAVRKSRLRDKKMMNRVLELARQAEGRTNPNPMVGAVVVDIQGQIVGEGWHQRAGEAHAEVHALAAAGESAHAGTLYVNLEPCSHMGRTPPCADAVVAAGLKRVVIAMEDPNPLVAGGGIENLRKAGVEVEVGLMAAEARQLNEVFLKHIMSGLPFVALKYAMSMDGKIAATGGDARWISGEESRHRVHQLRNIYDGILLGIGSVLSDDPLLNTRLAGAADIHHPRRIIADPLLVLPLNSRIAKTAKEYPTIIFCSVEAELSRAEALAERGIEIRIIAGDKESVDLNSLLKILYREEEICSLLVEGGSGINAAMVRQGLADKLYCFIAPKIIGGRQAPGPVDDLGIERVAEAIAVGMENISVIGSDIMVEGYFNVD